MRVRPFFWLLLAASCIGILIFAATIQEHVPEVMQVHIGQHHPAPVGLTTVELHLADTQGLPIEEARIFSSANMTNMDMVVDHCTGNFAWSTDQCTPAPGKLSPALLPALYYQGGKRRKN